MLCASVRDSPIEFSLRLLWQFDNENVSRKGIKTDLPYLFTKDKVCTFLRNQITSFKVYAFIVHYKFELLLHVSFKGEFRQKPYRHNAESPKFAGIIKQYFVL